MLRMMAYKLGFIQISDQKVSVFGCLAIKQVIEWSVKFYLDAYMLDPTS